MTWQRTLAKCGCCGKSFCPEEGGPECDCYCKSEDEEDINDLAEPS